MSLLHFPLFSVSPKDPVALGKRQPTTPTHTPTDDPGKQAAGGREGLDPLHPMEQPEDSSVVGTRHGSGEGK